MGGAPSGLVGGAAAGGGATCLRCLQPVPVLSTHGEGYKAGARAGGRSPCILGELAAAAPSLDMRGTVLAALLGLCASLAAGKQDVVVLKDLDFVKVPALGACHGGPPTPKRQESPRPLPGAPATSAVQDAPTFRVAVYWRGAAPDRRPALLRPTPRAPSFQASGTRLLLPPRRSPQAHPRSR